MMTEEEKFQWDRIKIDADESLTREQKAERMGIKVKNYTTLMARARLRLVAISADGAPSITLPELSQSEFDHYKHIIHVVEKYPRAEAAKILQIAPQSVASRFIKAKDMVAAYSKRPHLVKSDEWEHLGKYTAIWFTDGVFAFRNADSKSWTALDGTKLRDGLELIDLVAGRTVQQAKVYF